jgi:integrase
MPSILKFTSKNKGTRFRAQVFAGLRADGSKRHLYKTFNTAKAAKTWARDQETARGKGTLIEGRCTIGVLLDDLIDYYKRHRKGWWAPLLIDVHLRPFFGSLHADQITTTEINRYISQRQAKVKDSTIHGELAILHRAFRLGAEHEPPKVRRIPRIPHLQPSESRQGFFEDHEYSALLRELPEEVRPVLIYAYFTGSRKGEILALTWPEVDLDAHLVRLPGTKTKNGKPRTIPLAPDVLEALRMQKDIRDHYWPQCKWVFFRHATGKRLQDFRTAWTLASKRAGLWDPTAGKLDAKGKPEGKPTRLVHDLRRTAVRNLVRAGVSDHVARSISGHLTRSIFDRYDIVAERDLTDAAQRLDAHVREKRTTNGIHSLQEQQGDGIENPPKRLN